MDPVIRIWLSHHHHHHQDIKPALWTWLSQAGTYSLTWNWIATTIQNGNFSILDQLRGCLGIKCWKSSHSKKPNLRSSKGSMKRPQQHGWRKISAGSRGGGVTIRNWFHFVIDVESIRRETDHQSSGSGHFGLNNIMQRHACCDIASILLAANLSFVIFINTFINISASISSS